MVDHVENPEFEWAHLEDIWHITQFEMQTFKWKSPEMSGAMTPNVRSGESIREPILEKIAIDECRGKCPIFPTYIATYLTQLQNSTLATSPRTSTGGEAWAEIL